MATSASLTIWQDLKMAAIEGTSWRKRRHRVRTEGLNWDSE